ncbi:MAG TPA: ribbon-helix-helix protein, CopG family [Gemmatimonadaceae bacterium]
MAGQTSFRLPREMLRELGRVARARGVPKSQLVREALEQYLARPTAEGSPGLSIRDRSAPYIASINLSGPGDAESIADRVRRRNWRD